MPEGLRILVTGGAGFIGSHLTERLLSLGHHVTAIDNFHTGDAGNLKDLRRNPRFRFIEHDVREPFSPEGPLERIYNLACPASPKHYQRDPLYTLRTSVEGARHLLDLARTKGARLLQASTSEVYGDPELHPQGESYWGHVNPIGIRACYDEGKRCAETLCADYRRMFGVETRVARIFNTYGPRMQFDDGRVISNFLHQALTGAAITVHGDGLQTRSFCYVDDLVTGLIALMECEGLVPGPVNLGNPQEIRVKEIAKLILKETRSASPISFLPLPEDDPRRRQPDITRARKLLGWQPKTPLLKGLQLTMRDFERRLSAASALKLHA